jgi:YHS domain-containing protein
MYVSRVFFHWVTAFLVVAAMGAAPECAHAQGSTQQGQPKPAAPAQEQHQHPPPGQEPQADHTQHQAAGMALFPAREASGTAWLPDATPMYGIHRSAGSWQLMGHGNAFVQFLSDGGDRGHDQFGSINWVMGMAHRNLAGGRLGFRGMFSLEPGTVRGCGYPDLLATGERCNGEPITDRQHQHDLFMEIAAQYDRPFTSSVRWQVYGGLAAEPALGPAAYPHRVSAMPNLLAPIAHHWLDATHITFGVLTAGVYGNRWKTEASVFNGREPDEERTNFDLAPLDSVSGRVWFLPTPNLALQVSAGHLTEAEPCEDGGFRVDVTRVTASATYHRLLGEGGIWATTAAWGRNNETDHATNALLVETNLTLADRDTWFGRFEIVGKTAHDLDVPHSLVPNVEGSETFTVAKLQGGYSRYLTTWKGLKAGLGASASLGFVPSALEPVYGSRVNAGVGVFLTVRPAVMRMAAMAPAPAAAAPGKPAAAPTEHDHTTPKPPESRAPAAPGPEGKKPTAPPPSAPAAAGDPKLPVLPAERVIDPACAATINLTTAPRATYQGKVYYFCAPADREEFLKDPVAYLKKRGQQ